MKFKAIKNETGYISALPLPTEAELAQFYENKYFQNEKGNYCKSYLDEEKLYFENESIIAEYIFKNSFQGENRSLLDLGCGEGFFSKYFFSNGWNVTTCDYSSYGIEQQNSELLETFEQGSLIDSIEECINREESFSFINLQNVLEHVINPESLLIKLKEIVSSGGLIRIQVPNDYSSFQKLLLEKNLTKETWFAPPEHLHYFSIDSLKQLVAQLGYSVREIMTDFPIELFLLNESSNYAKDRGVGKYAYQSKIAANNFIFSKGCEQYVKFFSSCAEIDFGRNIILYIST